MYLQNEFNSRWWRTFIGASKFIFSKQMLSSYVSLVSYIKGAKSSLIHYQFYSNTIIWHAILLFMVAFKFCFWRKSCFIVHRFQLSVVQHKLCHFLIGCFGSCSFISSKMVDGIWIKLKSFSVEDTIPFMFYNKPIAAGVLTTQGTMASGIDPLLPEYHASAGALFTNIVLH